MKRILSSQNLLDFDGTDDSVDCASRSSLDNVTTYTFIATIKADTIAAGINEIAAKYGSSSNVGPVYMEIDNTGGGRIVTFWSDGGAGQLCRSVGGAITTNTWYRLCSTLSGGGSTGKIYIDGVETTYGLNQAGGALQSDASNNFQIGKIGISGGQRFFDGIITEVAIWNTALSTTDILRLGRSTMRGLPLHISPSNLRGYWPLDDTFGVASGHNRTLYDLSGNLNHGTGSRGSNATGLLGKQSQSPYSEYSPIYLEKKSSFNQSRLSRLIIPEAAAAASTQASQRMMMGFGT